MEQATLQNEIIKYLLGRVIELEKQLATTANILGGTTISQGPLPGSGTIPLPYRGIGETTGKQPDNSITIRQLNPLCEHVFPSAGLRICVKCRGTDNLILTNTR